MSFYTSIIILSWMGLAALCILVMENNRIAKDGKRLLYLTYALIALSALAEWVGIQLDGRTDLPVWLLRTVKCIDYILTPMAGGALVIQIRLNNRWQKAIYGTMIANTVFQIVSAFTGWMLIVDSQNRYSHGPLFPLYMGICVVIIIILIAQFITYGKSFRKENKHSLYASMLIVVAGILFQELAESRTAYIGMTLCAALMFIHYSEFAQLTADDYILKQQTALDTDPLTGLYSRYAYTKVLEEYGTDSLPENLAVFVIDVNGLKKTNDTKGHEAGDELLRGTAECILSAFGETGRCYRTGGDEFIITVPDLDRARADELLAALQARIDAWHSEKVNSIHISAGYALSSDNPGVTFEGLVNNADIVMYTAKEAYYRTSGEDRRRTYSSPHHPA